MKIKRPNGGLYFGVYVLVYPFLKVCFRLKVNRSNYHPPKGPFIVVANHAAFMDFVLVMLSMYPRRLNAVAAQKFFLYRPLNKLLPIMGCIPKNLFDPDIRSIMGIKSVLKRGGRVLLFPEGRCSTDGAYAGIHKSTGKLVKKLGVPVMSCYIEGGYTCMPYWRKGIRFGRERVTLANLFSTEDIQALSEDEINDAIDARLSGKDAEPPRKPYKTFRSRRLAEGLENILYVCHTCRQEFMHETSGNTIRCTACGATTRMDAYARLTPVMDGAQDSATMRKSFRHEISQKKIAKRGAVPHNAGATPDTIHAWFKEQVLYEMERLSEDMEPVTERVTVRKPAAEAGSGMAQCGSGTIKLDSEGWYYDGELSGEQVSLFFPIDTVPAIPFDPVDNFQIYSKGTFYMFTPEDARRVVKYAVLGECAYHRFATRNQMTPGKCFEK